MSTLNLIFAPWISKVAKHSFGLISVFTFFARAPTKNLFVSSASSCYTKLTFLLLHHLWKWLNFPQFRHCLPYAGHCFLACCKPQLPQIGLRLWPSSCCCAPRLKFCGFLVSVLPRGLGFRLCALTLCTCSMLVSSVKYCTCCLDCSSALQIVRALSSLRSCTRNN